MNPKAQVLVASVAGVQKRYKKQIVLKWLSCMLYPHLLTSCVWNIIMWPDPPNRKSQYYL